MWFSRLISAPALVTGFALAERATIASRAADPQAESLDLQVTACLYTSLYNFAKFVEWPFGRPGRERRRQPSILRLR